MKIELWITEKGPPFAKGEYLDGIRKAYDSLNEGDFANVNTKTKDTTTTYQNPPLPSLASNRIPL